MEATVTEIYNHSESYTDANQYTARNTACFNLFTHLAANPPTGWSVSSSSIPSPSSSAYGVYYVILEGQGFRMKIYNSSSAARLYVEIQNTSGTAILVSGAYMAVGVTSGSYQYDFNIIMTSYVTANKLYAILFSSSLASLKMVVAKIYAENKATGAEDFYIFSEFYSADDAVGAMTAATTIPLITPSREATNSSGQHLAMPAYVAQLSAPNLAYASLINTLVMDSGSLSGSYTTGLYSDGTDIYLLANYVTAIAIKL